MPIDLKRIGNCYVGTATPPESDERWESNVPLTAKQIIAELRRVGCHTTDISDSLFDIDPFLQNRLNEPDLVPADMTRPRGDRRRASGALKSAFIPDLSAS